MATYKERVKVGDEEKWVTGHSRQELHLAIAQVLMENGLLDGRIPKEKPAVPTVREFVEQIYQKTYIDPLAPTTVENYAQYLKRNVLPYLGDMRLDEVSVSTIQQFYNWMASAASQGRKKNLNRRSIERIGGFTSRIFKVAFEMGLIPEMPFKNTLLRIRAEEAGHHKALPDEEVHRIKQGIPLLPDPRERVFMGLLAYTGMRQEEILGLQWENIDWNLKYCEITHSVTYPRNSKPCLRKGGKNVHSCRTVILPEPLIAILQSVPHQEGFLLGGDSPLCWATYERIRKKAFANLNIKGFSNHDFRTTYATQLCEMGISSKEVADLLGHADTRMVETVYARRRHEGVMKHSALLNTMNSAYWQPQTLYNPPP